MEFAGSRIVTGQRQFHDALLPVLLEEREFGKLKLAGQRNWNRETWNSDQVCPPIDGECADPRLKDHIGLAAGRDQVAALAQDPVPQRRHQVQAIGALNIAGVDKDLGI